MCVLNKGQLAVRIKKKERKKKKTACANSLIT